ncbi:unnamed protein product [Amoebophrya sp. A120]|nr:unnamed protein product [Amoebophrya sp. A120]|eukprot:GSA120T00010114001.1
MRLLSSRTCTSKSRSTTSTCTSTTRSILTAAAAAAGVALFLQQEHQSAPAAGRRPWFLLVAHGLVQEREIAAVLVEHQEEDSDDLDPDESALQIQTWINHLVEEQEKQGRSWEGKRPQQTFLPADHESSHYTSAESADIKNEGEALSTRRIEEEQDETSDLHALDQEQILSPNFYHYAKLHQNDHDDDVGEQTGAAAMDLDLDATSSHENAIKFLQVSTKTATQQHQREQELLQQRKLFVARTKNSLSHQEGTTTGIHHHQEHDKTSSRAAGTSSTFAWTRWVFSYRNQLAGLVTGKDSYAKEAFQNFARFKQRDVRKVENKHNDELLTILKTTSTAPSPKEDDEDLHLTFRQDETTRAAEQEQRFSSSSVFQDVKPGQLVLVKHAHAAGLNTSGGAGAPGAAAGTTTTSKKMSNSMLMSSTILMPGVSLYEAGASRGTTGPKEFSHMPTLRKLVGPGEVTAAPRTIQHMYRTAADEGQTSHINWGEEVDQIFVLPENVQQVRIFLPKPDANLLQKMEQAESRLAKNPYYRGDKFQGMMLLLDPKARTFAPDVALTRDLPSKVLEGVETKTLAALEQEKSEKLAALETEIGTLQAELDAVVLSQPQGREEEKMGKMTSMSALLRLVKQPKSVVLQKWKERQIRRRKFEKKQVEAVHSEKAMAAAARKVRHMLAQHFCTTWACKTKSKAGASRTTLSWFARGENKEDDHKNENPLQMTTAEDDSVLQDLGADLEAYTADLEAARAYGEEQEGRGRQRQELLTIPFQFAPLQGDNVLFLPQGSHMRELLGAEVRKDGDEEEQGENAKNAYETSRTSTEKQGQAAAGALLPTTSASASKHAATSKKATASAAGLAVRELQTDQGLSKMTLARVLKMFAMRNTRKNQAKTQKMAQDLFGGPLEEWRLRDDTSFVDLIPEFLLQKMWAPFLKHLRLQCDKAAVRGRGSKNTSLLAMLTDMPGGGEAEVVNHAASGAIAPTSSASASSTTSDDAGAGMQTFLQQRPGPPSSAIFGPPAPRPKKSSAASAIGPMKISAAPPTSPLPRGHGRAASAVSAPPPPRGTKGSSANILLSPVPPMPQFSPIFTRKPGRTRTPSASGAGRSSSSTTSSRGRRASPGSTPAGRNSAFQSPTWSPLARKNGKISTMSLAQHHAAAPVVDNNIRDSTVDDGFRSGWSATRSTISDEDDPVRDAEPGRPGSSSSSQVNFGGTQVRRFVIGSSPESYLASEDSASAASSPGPISLANQELHRAAAAPTSALRAGTPGTTSAGTGTSPPEISAPAPGTAGQPVVVPPKAKASGPAPAVPNISAPPPGEAGQPVVEERKEVANRTTSGKDYRLRQGPMAGPCFGLWLRLRARAARFLWVRVPC